MAYFVHFAQHGQVLKSTKACFPVHVYVQSKDDNKLSGYLSKTKFDDYLQTMRTSLSIVI